MDHRYALLPLLLAAVPSWAQLSSSDCVPSPGMQIVQHYCQHIPPNGGGVGTTEDFSALVTDSTETVTYVAPGSTPNGAQFPEAELSWTDGNGNYTYYNVSGSIFEDLGWDLGGSVGLASDPETWAVFPLGYGTTWSDAHAITFNSGGFPIARSGTVFGQGDANNTTLIMPYGTVTDVKRVFMYDTYTDDIGGFMTITYNFTYYFYYKSGAHMPLLIVQDLLITPSIGTPTHKLFSVYSETAVGVEESAVPAMQLRAFPSPADDAVTIAWTDGAVGTVDLELVDAAGAVVRAYQLTANGAGPQREQLPTSDLPAGVYIVRLRSRDAITTTQLVVLH